MRVTKNQIVNGVISYMESEVIPQVDDKPTQIFIAIAVKSVQANSKLVDSIFANQLVKTLLDADENGTYELDGIMKSAEESLKQYGAFPVIIPAIPLISNSEKTLAFSESDINEIKRRIERSN